MTPLEQLTYNCNNVFTYLAVASMDEVIQGLSSSLKIKFSNSCVCVCVSVSVCFCTGLSLKWQDATKIVSCSAETHEKSDVEHIKTALDS